MARQQNAGGDIPMALLFTLITFGAALKAPSPEDERLFSAWILSGLVVTHAQKWKNAHQILFHHVYTF
jgi:hypothetical protein